MSTIAIAGAGVGGLVAAWKLALAGHDVTVYERNREEDCGHEQKDSFDATAMEYAGIEIPKGYIAPGNDITFYPLDESIEPITAPSPENYKNITVDRKILFAYLKGLAQVAGAKFSFETEISA
ncbi:MAG: NAD(P)-binding protein, partial [Clostridia bacterium]|nr:NAD(P)-binding protein [Clostridia bacterium]